MIKYNMKCVMMITTSVISMAIGRLIELYVV